MSRRKIPSSGERNWERGMEEVCDALTFHALMLPVNRSSAAPSSPSSISRRVSLRKMGDPSPPSLSPTLKLTSPCPIAGEANAEAPTRKATKPMQSLLDVSGPAPPDRALPRCSRCDIRKAPHVPPLPRKLEGVEEINPAGNTTK